MIAISQLKRRADDMILGAGRDILIKAESSFDKIPFVFPTASG
jgi:hypothetical protein